MATYPDYDLINIAKKKGIIAIAYQMNESQPRPSAYTPHDIISQSQDES